MFCSNYNILNINVRTYASDKLSFPQIKQPNLIGDYSLSPDGDFENSGARIRFLPELPPNLSHFSVKKSEDITVDGDEEGTTENYLDNMFYFLASSQERFQLQADIDIVCTRDVLQVLMCSPYDYTHNWTIVVSKYRNTIYMCQIHSTESSAASSFDFEKLKTNLKSMSLKKLRQSCMGAMGNYIQSELFILYTDRAHHIDYEIVQPGTYHQREERGQYYGVFTMDICGIRLLFDAPVLAQQSQNAL